MTARKFDGFYSTTRKGLFYKMKINVKLINIPNYIFEQNIQLYSDSVTNAHTDDIVTL